MKVVYFLQMIVFAGLLCSCKLGTVETESSPFYHNLAFDKLPEVWDEAIPLGNGLTGALIWQRKDGCVLQSTVRTYGICVRSRSSTLPIIRIGSFATR